MENLKQERKQFESLGLSYLPNNQVKVEKVTLAGITNYWFTPARVESDEIVVFLHGGGFIYGSIRSHRAMVSHIAAATGRKILFVEYSLAPEKPFPAALNETTAVIRELLNTIPNIHFALMGDSAGGNLAMSTALNLKKLNLPSPRYQVLISPWLNMATEYGSYAENKEKDPIISKEFVEYAGALYTGKENFGDPLVSPVLGAFEGFSPTLTLVGNREILRDDSLELHRALEKAGCSSRLKAFEEVTHVWTLTDIDSADSQEALNTIREFMTSVSNGVTLVNR